jgi:phage gpG-like protein
MNNLQGFDDLDVTIDEFLARISHPDKPLREIRTMLASSVIENFRVGGRPPWQPSLRVKKHGGQTLLLSGRLMKSLSLPQIEGSSIVWGSNLRYFRIHQLGGEIEQAPRSELFLRNRFTKNEKRGQFKKGTKPGRGFTFGNRKIIIIPRPPIAFTQQDVSDAGRILFDYALGR